MSYKKECMYCKNEILMSETLGKWFPLNLEDNSLHVCREKKAAANGNRADSSISSVKTGSIAQKPLPLLARCVDYANEHDT